MIFSAFQREDDDAIFTVVKNVSGAALATGESVVWDVVDPDGVRVSVPAANTLCLFRGVVAEPIANGAWGKVQVGGYCSYAKVTNNTTADILAGDVLIPTTTKYLSRGAAGSGGSTGFAFYGGATFASSTNAAAVATKEVFLRAL